MANSDKNYYFRQSALWNRVLGLVDGNPDRVLQWWETPLPYAPFNLRAPTELVNDAEISKLEAWLVANTHGPDTEDPWKYKDFRRIQNKATDINYFNQSNTLNNNRSEQMNYLQQISEVDADGGNISYYKPSTANNRQFYGNWAPPANNTETPWKIHTFTSSGTFYVRVGGYIEYLIVGGGGGGGGGYNGSYPLHPSSAADGAGGGGGGGGVVQGSMYLPSGTWVITVGAGGSGGYDNIDYSPFRQSSSGGNSSAFGITAYGGGVGGSAVYTSQNYNFNNTTTVPLGSGQSAGARGYTNAMKASGGGGGYAVNAGVDGMGGQGFAGGNWLSGNGGGGGGAGGPGSNASTERGGDGGIGVLSSITGTATYYGGGGGGGCSNQVNAVGGGTFGGNGGAGGGATAYQYNQRQNNPSGSANTGGGGAGSTAGYAAGNGGSGIVIIRYQDTKDLR